MKLFAVAFYVILMLYFLFSGLTVAFWTMLVMGVIFIGSLPKWRENSIRVAKKKIIDASKLKQQGQVVKPFIEINSSPWFVLAQLPGITNEMAKNAVRLRRTNGSFPNMDVFFKVIGVKHVYIEHIKTFAYIKDEVYNDKN